MTDKEILNLAQAELRAMYKRLGIKGSNVLTLIDEALRQPPISGELNCEHDWFVDMYDHFGFPASRFCDKCNTREAI